MCKKSNWKKAGAVFLSAILLAGICQPVPAQQVKADTKMDRAVKESVKNDQPYVPCFFPEDLLKWSAKTDLDVAYSTSTIPLAKRIASAKLPTSNRSQKDGMKVLAISIMNSGTSGNMAQGSAEFMGRANMFSYWQYVDTLVYWGGSSGEGIIVPPSADVTDAGHKNGVPVLGTVFFPQKEHGGRTEWVSQMLTQKDDGSFPAADKLLEMAKTMNFDGWFINQETDGVTKEQAKQMQEMIQYMKKKAPKLEIVWYDSMVEDGSIDWQNALNEKNQMFLIDTQQKPVADSMFLNFWWTNKNYVKQELLKRSKQQAEQLGLDPYELYAGIDIQADGTNTPIRWDLIADENGKPYTSLGLYCPSWSYYTSGKNVTEYLQKESRLWVNANGDPNKPDRIEGNDWKGISNYKKENSVLSKTPFLTNFSMGHGMQYFIDGKKYSDQEWNNRSMQDILPTYRYSITNGAGCSLKADMDYKTAYQGGNSLALTGAMKAKKQSKIDLYSADLKVKKGMYTTITAKSKQAVNLKLYLTFSDNTSKTIKGNQTIKSAWTQTKFNLSSCAGKTIQKISLKIEAQKSGNQKINLGQLAILNGTKTKPILKTAVVKKATSEDRIHAGIRIDLGKKTSDIAYYEIYRKTSKGKELVKTTVNPKCYLADIKRDGKETTARFEAAAVTTSGTRSKVKAFAMKWGSYPKPQADFTMDKTLAAPGEKIRFTSLSSKTTEHVQWNFEGAKTTKSTKNNPTVIYEKEGTYTVTLTAKNSSGTNRITKKDTIVISKKAAEQKELARNCTCTSSGYVNEKESDQNALDGSLSTKWCATGEGPHTITIDLGKEYLIGAVEIAHAQSGGEGSDYNTKAFTIACGTDGKSFPEKTVVTDNKEAVSRTPVKPVKARYIKLTINQASQGGDTAARIYEIQVYGCEVE